MFYILTSSFKSLDILKSSSAKVVKKHTQRPDANVIPGQIKNNMTYRACGHADKTLSQIVIDSTDAAEMPSDYPDRFITVQEKSSRRVCLVIISLPGELVVFFHYIAFWMRVRISIVNGFFLSCRFDTLNRKHFTTDI